MRTWTTSALIGVLSSSVLAQLELPVPLTMTSSDGSQRQVIGLAYPLTTDAAVSVDAARFNAVKHASVSGQLQLVGNLSPAPSGYAAGMIVNAIPDSVNTWDATLDLNGLGSRPLLKSDGTPIDSADLRPGVPIRLLYDGFGFRVISSILMPCPEGYIEGGREYCIESESRSDTTFYGSVGICRKSGARLCSMAEWVHACTSNAWFIGTVMNHEWVDSAANNTNGAKRVGNGGDGTPDGEVGIDCLHGSWAAYPTGISRFRCCKSR